MMGDLGADIIPIHLMVTDVVMPEMNKLSPSSTAPGTKSGTSLPARSG